MPQRLVITAVVWLVLCVTPTVAAASDFSGLAYFALAIIAGVGLACLVGGYITALLLMGRKSRGTTIAGTLAFAVAWFVVGWFVMEIIGL